MIYIYDDTALKLWHVKGIKKLDNSEGIDSVTWNFLKRETNNLVFSLKREFSKKLHLGRNIALAIAATCED